MEGGIKAWNGLKIEGPPEAGMFSLSSEEPTEKVLAAAWLLEEGSRRFYENVSRESADGETTTLFRELAAAEEHHKALLIELWKEFKEEPPPPDFPEGVIGIPRDDLVLEGGMSLEEARRWSAGKSPQEILELAVGFESNAYDRYMLMMRLSGDDKNRRVFEELAEEEKIHLQNLTGHLRRLSGI